MNDYVFIVLIILVYCVINTISLRLTSKSPDKFRNGCVAYSSFPNFGSKFKVIDKNIDGSDCLVIGSFEDLVQEEGWGKLHIKSVSSCDIKSVASQNDNFYAAGLLEGYLSFDYISIFWKNYYAESFAKPPSDELKNFINENEEWLAFNIEKYAETDSYWRQVGAIQSQLRGIVDGYNRRRSSSLPKLGLFEFKLLNMNGDLFDILDNFRHKRPNHARKWKPDQFVPTHCSALIKVLPDFSDFFVAHSTWDVISNSYPRIYKHIHLPVYENGDSSACVDFASHYSSMPGYLSSVDDFYAVKGFGDLSVMETSNSIYNEKLYDLLVPESVMSWMRVMTANMLAHSGKHWSTIFEKYNSGTYNNQWMIVDLNKWNNKLPPSEGFFYVLEQIPGQCVYEDQTQLLVDNSYFPSYNIPFYPSIYNASGYPEMAKKSSFPYTYSHENCERAILFAAIQDKVVDIKTMQQVIGWNNNFTPTGQYSDQINWTDPAIGISSRLDLSFPKPRSYGGIDGKMASYKSLKASKQYARAGPTHDDLPTFCWSTALVDGPHVRHVDCLGWHWQEMSPKF